MTKTANQVTPKKEEKKKGRGVARRSEAVSSSKEELRAKNRSPVARELIEATAAERISTSAASAQASEVSASPKLHRRRRHHRRRHHAHCQHRQSTAHRAACPPSCSFSSLEHQLLLPPPLPPPPPPPRLCRSEEDMPKVEVHQSRLTRAAAALREEKTNSGTDGYV